MKYQKINEEFDMMMKKTNGVGSNIATVVKWGQTESCYEL